eukprot:4507519-Amphidinium_carterae.1
MEKIKRGCSQASRKLVHNYQQLASLTKGQNPLHLALSLHQVVQLAQCIGVSLPYPCVPIQKHEAQNA